MLGQASIVKSGRGWYLIHASLSENLFFTSRAEAKDRAEVMGFEIYQESKAAPQPKRSVVVLRGFKCQAGSEGLVESYTFR